MKTQGQAAVDRKVVMIRVGVEGGSLREAGEAVCEEDRGREVGVSLRKPAVFAPSPYQLSDFLQLPRLSKNLVSIILTSFIYFPRQVAASLFRVR